MWTEGQTTGQGSTRATRKAAADCIAHAGRRCQIQHAGCTRIATEAHHVDGLADTGRRRSDANAALIAVCSSCHDVETQRQARRGRNRWKRQPEPHPGLLRPRPR